ncbi:MAG: ADP-forming succinate--CoA ligase subunit beta [Christensenellales bacterium]|jgi:succinyl-CoA synthetase beta subunit
MKLLEYKAKELFEAAGIPSMKGVVIDKAEGISEKLSEAGLTYPVVIKAQVQVGGRGKAGGIQFANNAAEAEDWCKKLLFSDLKGFKVNQLLLVEKANPVAEWYLSIMLDRLSKCPLIIFSACGGVDIEEVAKTDPDKIIKLPINPFLGIQDYAVRYLIDKSGIDAKHTADMKDILVKLYEVFIKNDCLLAEINPLVLDANGSIIALDGKVDVDDSALYRQPDILAFRDSLQEEELVVEARKFNLLYIPVEEGGTIGVMSNGSGMLMSCIDLITKEGMKVGAALDLGGGATKEKISEAVRIMLSTPGMKAIFICIFGGITRCDEVAGGVKLALEKQEADKIVITRMEGTNKEKGLEIIASIGGDVVAVNGVREGVAALAERRASL